jgi:hypothetical protein
MLVSSPSHAPSLPRSALAEEGDTAVATRFLNGPRWRIGIPYGARIDGSALWFSRRNHSVTVSTTGPLVSAPFDAVTW